MTQLQHNSGDIRYLCLDFWLLERGSDQTKLKKYLKDIYFTMEMSGFKIFPFIEMRTICL